MPNIRPITDLRNNINEIATICREQQEPVFITRNGYGDLVLMSIEQYEKQQEQLTLYRMLSESEAQIQKGETMTHEEVFGRLREKHGQQG